MKKTALFLSTALLTASFSLVAQDSTSTVATEAESDDSQVPLSISGSVDAYFRANLEAPQTRPGGASVAPATSFANLDGFSLGMANIILSKEGEKSGFVADLVFGPRGTDAVFNSPFYSATGNIVNQLYAYLNVGEKVKFTLGNFNTFVGYEVISPTANFNYSCSYMFSWGPFSHTGLKADIALTDNISAMLAVMNPTDWTEMNQFGTYTYGAQLGYSNDKGGTYLNFLYGDQDGDPVPSGSVLNYKPYTQIDLTTGYNLTDAFYAGLNYTVAKMATNDTLTAGNNIGKEMPTPAFSGIALYLQYAFSDAFSLGARAEYFEETNQQYTGAYNILGAYTAGGTGKVTDITLSANIKKGSLTLIPEIRTDIASKKIFLTPNYKPNDILTSFVLAAVYAF